MGNGTVLRAGVALMESVAAVEGPAKGAVYPSWLLNLTEFKLYEVAAVLVGLDGHECMQQTPSRARVKAH